jgi:hypothetical protein
VEPSHASFDPQGVEAVDITLSAPHAR